MTERLAVLEAAKVAVLARLERAQKLQRELDAAIVAYERFDVGTIKSYNPETGVTELKIQIPPMPQEWGFLASEVLHHARSSLDNALVSVAESRLTEPIDGWKPKFPLYLDNESFEKHAFTRSLKGLDEDLIEVVRSLQPFSFAGKLANSLSSLAKLNNADKHSSLSIVGAVFTEQIRISDIRFGFQGGHNGATLHGHSTDSGRLANDYAILSVKTKHPYKEAFFETVKFLDHDLRFDTVIESFPEFSVDDFVLAIDDVRTVCKTLFDAA